ncbi:hypothetical protein STEG23_032779 [Scotinomys teguina]
MNTQAEQMYSVVQLLHVMHYYWKYDLDQDRSDPIWIPEQLVRRVQETPRRQDEVSDADDAPVHPIAGTE